MASPVVSPATGTPTKVVLTPIATTSSPAKASTTSTSPSATIDYKAASEAAPRTGNGVYGVIAWVAVVFGAVLFI